MHLLALQETAPRSRSTSMTATLPMLREPSPWRVGAGSTTPTTGWPLSPDQSFHRSSLAGGSHPVANPEAATLVELSKEAAPA